MKPQLVRSPDEPSTLASLPIHVVVRDFPESLPILRDEGLDLGLQGSHRLGHAGDDLVKKVLKALAWRREG